MAQTKQMAESLEVLSDHVHTLVAVRGHGYAQAVFSIVAAYTLAIAVARLNDDTVRADMTEEALARTPTGLLVFQMLRAFAFHLHPDGSSKEAEDKRCKYIEEMLRDSTAIYDVTHKL